MSNVKEEGITDIARVFLEPSTPTHRQYEALRAFFVEGLPSHVAASRFGYTPGSFRVMCHDFRRDPTRPFFFPARRRTPPPAPRRRSHDRVIALRKENLSIYDISAALAEDGQRLSPAAVSIILRKEGFAKLPRRGDEERPAGVRPDPAAVADVRELDLSPRQFRTQFGGLFLFMPYLAAIPLDSLLQQAGFPGSKMVPSGHAIRALLGLKLFGSARHSHIMSSVFDQGLALFAGLNVVPKRAFLTEYSCRVTPASYPKLMRSWFDAVGKLGLARGVSFDLDFHTIPFHGEEALIEKHYVSKRSRRQKGLLAFLAQDATTRVFCYANADVRKDRQNDEVLRFVDFWRERTGRLPQELVFDSKLTTHANLNRLNKLGIEFMTLRRRSPQMLAELRSVPASAWRRIELEGIARVYRTPRILDQRITLGGYEGDLRQLIITDLGHEEPTFLLTNQLRRSPTKLVDRYARRMIIENSISDGIDFFHMDALSSAVALKVNCDLQLTLMASSLYRLLGARIGAAYTTAESRHIFRDFINATAQVTVGTQDVTVRFQKRAHNPLLLAAGFAEDAVPVPWLNGKRLRLAFG